MKIDCDHRYLLFPVSTHAQKKSLRFHREGHLLLDLDLSLDNVTPDYEVAVDVGRFGPGETAPLRQPQLCRPVMVRYPRFRWPPYPRCLEYIRDSGHAFQQMHDPPV